MPQAPTAEPPRPPGRPPPTPDEVAALVVPCEPLVWWLARRAARGADWQTTEEVAAAIRLRLVIAAREYDPAGLASFGGFVRRVALHQARKAANVARWRGFRPPREFDPAAPVPQVVSLDAPGGRENETVGDTLADRPRADPPPDFPADFWDAVGRAAGLTPREQAAVEMRYGQSLSPREIGRRTGVGPTRAPALLNAAMNKLAAAADRLRLLVPPPPE